MHNNCIFCGQIISSSFGCSKSECQQKSIAGHYFVTQNASHPGSLMNHFEQNKLNYEQLISDRLTDIIVILDRIEKKLNES